MQLKTNPHPAGSDEFFQYEALGMAYLGLGWTSPNPAVGCVLVRDGRIIGRGAHLHDGEKHAEVNALIDARDANGATAYVTLEPCTHFGRQPSCCHMLAAAGVKRVVYGCEDSDRRTAGAAYRLLPRFGIEVTSGVLLNECETFLDYYLHTHTSNRPFVHLKLALSLDAKLACRTGDSQWLSGPESLGYAHFLRQKYDAVMVGWNTVIMDNPRLTVRPEVLAGFLDPGIIRQSRDPVRVVIDPRFELANRLNKLNIGMPSRYQRNSLPSLILIGNDDCIPSNTALNIGILTLGVRPKNNGRLPYNDIYAKLWQVGIRSILVEGGGNLASDIIACNMADKLTMVYTPVIIGGSGIGISPDLDTTAITDCPKLNRPRAFAMGRDAVLEGYPVWPSNNKQNGV